MAKEGEYGANTMYTCMQIENDTWETTPGIGETGIKENGGCGGVNTTMIYLIYCKNFC
jgi:hypothetical protein